MDRQIAPPWFALHLVKVKAQCIGFIKLQKNESACARAHSPQNSVFSGDRKCAYPCMGKCFWRKADCDSGYATTTPSNALLREPCGNDRSDQTPTRCAGTGSRRMDVEACILSHLPHWKAVRRTDGRGRRGVSHRVVGWDRGVSISQRLLLLLQN